jgi:hypothetical protein
MQNIECYYDSRDLLTKYLEGQCYTSFASGLYAEKIFENSSGKTIKLLISEPIIFKIETNFNSLLEKNIHAGINIAPQKYSVNTLYLIDNQNISKLDDSLYFYSNSNIQKYLTNIQFIKNSKTYENTKLVEAFDITNIVNKHYANFNEHAELDNLIKKTLIK